MSQGSKPDDRECWSIRTVIAYALLQLPALTLLILALIFIQRWVEIPAWFFWGLISLWLTKDIILFRYTWRAYDSNRPPSGVNAMIGVQGIAEEQLNPSGYIRIGGELWKAVVAEGDPPVERGGGVRVKGAQGLTLRVEPDKEENA